MIDTSRPATPKTSGGHHGGWHLGNGLGTMPQGWLHVQTGEKTLALGESDFAASGLARLPANLSRLKLKTVNGNHHV